MLKKGVSPIDFYLRNNKGHLKGFQTNLNHFLINVCHIWHLSIRRREWKKKALVHFWMNSSGRQRGKQSFVSFLHVVNRCFLCHCDFLPRRGIETLSLWKLSSESMSKFVLAIKELRGCLCKNHPLNFASKIILPETLLTERLYQV